MVDNVDICTFYELSNGAKFLKRVFASVICFNF